MGGGEPALRRGASKHDPRLLDAFDAVIDELRRRVGQTFTLEELAQAYDAAEHWARTAIADRAAFPGWPRSLTDVLDAAFHLLRPRRNRLRAVTRARRRPGRRALVTRWLVVLAAFVLGLALGAALDDGPEPGTTTFDRTLTVVTLTSTR